MAELCDCRDRDENAGHQELLSPPLRNVRLHGRAARRRAADCAQRLHCHAQLLDRIELAIERLRDGEVSPFFHDVAQVGDTIELRGPLGGHFLWPGPTEKPVLLIGAGSGVVPLMAMIRYRKASAEPVPVALLLSSRTWGDVLFRDELLDLERSLPDFALALALTRERATRRTDFSRRIDARMVADVAARLPVSPGCAFVCGSNAFVEIAADAALAFGLEAAAIKTERYGG